MMTRQILLNKSVHLKFKKEAYKLHVSVEQSAQSQYQEDHQQQDDDESLDGSNHASSYLSLELVHLETGQKWDSHLQDACTIIFSKLKGLSATQ